MIDVERVTEICRKCRYRGRTVIKDLINKAGNK